MERSRLLGLLVVLACLTAMAWTIVLLGPRSIAAVAVDADPSWLAASFLPLIARYLVWGIKWRRILGRREAISYSAALRILLAGSFVNLTTPTAKLAGGALRAVLLRRHFGWSLTSAYGRAFADQATGVLGTIALFGVLAVGASIAAPQLPARPTLAIGGGLALLGLGTLIGLRGTIWRQLDHPRLGRLLTRVVPARFRDEMDPGHAGSAVTDIFFPFLGEGRAGRTLATDILWAAGSFLLLCLSSAMVMRALGVDVSLWAISVAVVLGYFAGVIVGVWGGIGVTEASLTALYVQVGIPASTATAGALLHRASYYVVVLVWGGLALLREGRIRHDSQGQDHRT